MSGQILRVLFVLQFFWLVQAGYAQRQTQFSTDTAKFVRDLTQYFMENSANKDQAAEYMRNFENLWRTNVVAGVMKETVMETANTMLGRRMKPYPFFIGYL